MFRFTVLCCAFFLFVPSALANAAGDLLGRKIEDFNLQDFRGKKYSLQSFQEYPVLVIAFLGTECPLVKLYGPRLAEMAKEYQSQGVGFVGINANSQDSITEMANYARRHEVDFPLLKDVGNRVADQIGASRTPEVFVVDRERVVRYYGRIDDQYGIGYVRAEAEQHDLRQAVDELLAGEEVSNPTETAVGCIIGRVRKPDTQASVTYSNQIARIMQKHCVECHREGEIAPFELTKYSEVAGWAEMIAEVVQEKRMPPWFASGEHGNFSNARRMSDEELQLVYDWVEAGAPEGNPENLPSPRKWTSGWQLPSKPDFVLPICEEPYRVPAEGVIDYKYFTIDPNFEEDKWVSGIEIRPGNRDVVHHVLMFSSNSDNPRRDISRQFRGGVRGYDGLYVPGYRLQSYPAGAAKKIEAGSKLFFQVHYTPVGTEQLDQSYVAMTFMNEEDVRFEVRTSSAANNALSIPPNEGNHRSEAGSPRLPDSAKLISFLPHMHLRGKSFFYEIVYPGGKRQPLLDVPNYDFNWQLEYILDDSIEVPEGSRIHCVAHYDNSESNLANPDPTETVRWGDQTWEEMLIGYFNYLVPRDSNLTLPADREANRAVELFYHLDSNVDEVLTKDEIPQRFLFMFNLLDKNNDQHIALEEMKSMKTFLQGLNNRRDENN